MKIPDILLWSQDETNIYDSNDYAVVYDCSHKDDAEYIVQAANHFPEAVELLKESKEVLELMKNYSGGRVPNNYVNLYNSLNQFLTKLENEE